MAPGLGSGVCPHPQPELLGPGLGLSGLGARSGPHLNYMLVPKAETEGCYLRSCLWM